jgi:amidase
MRDPFASALEVADAIRRRERSPLEVVDSYLERISRLEPLLNAFDHRADDDVRNAARRATEVVARTPAEELPPFFGVPIPIKATNAVAGWPLSGGSCALPLTPQKADAPIVARLRAAGFIPLGMTTTPELATVSVTESVLRGATRNPWNIEHTPGGSSGGGAAAVAAGLAPLAHGSDGGGSIRGPASNCGLVGLKASRARIPNVIVALEGLATNGVLTHTVADTAAVLDVLAIVDRHSWYVAPPSDHPFAHAMATPPGRLRVALSTQPLLDIPVAPACREAVQRAGRVLQSLGHEVFEFDPPYPDRAGLIRDFATLWQPKAVGVTIDDWCKVEPLNRALHHASLRTDQLTHVQTVSRLQMQSREILPAWGRDYDVLVTPTQPFEPPRIGWLWEQVGIDPLDPLQRALQMASFTAVMNILGLPAISLPLHVSPSGLPVGVQFVAGPWEEARLLSLCGQIEAASPWRHRHPALSLSPNEPRT